jgi:hypothetical protein
VSAEASKRRGGLFSDDLPAIAYVLRLPDRSARAFHDLQKFVDPRNADAIDLKVAVAMKEVPAGATSMKVWIDLSLSAAQGYFTLVDGGTLHFDRTERFGKPPTP